MKIEITTSPKNVEMANFMLARAVEFFNEYPQLREQWDVTEKDIEKATAFRQSMLKAFLKPQGGK